MGAHNAEEENSGSAQVQQGRSSRLRVGGHVKAHEKKKEKETKKKDKS